MNGSLSVHSIRQFLTSKANGLNENFSPTAEFTYIEIRDMMAGLAESMVAAAMMNPSIVARELFTKGRHDYDNVWRDATYWGTHKIQGIKMVRVLTGCGLKEAKDAYEREHPVFLGEVARRALRDLEAANQRADYRGGVRIDADDFRDAIRIPGAPRF